MYKMRTIALKLINAFRFICIMVYSIRYVTFYKHFKSPVITVYTTGGAAQGGGGEWGSSPGSRLQWAAEGEAK